MNYFASIIGMLIALFFLAGGCSNSDAANPLKPSQTLKFIQEPVNEPVVLSGTAGWPVFVTDPCVIKDQEGYHLFYTSLFCKKGGEYYYSWDAANPLECNPGDMIGIIGYAFSSDKGLTWEFRGNPVVTKGPEAWQSADLETPFVLQRSDTLYLFYSALGLRNGVEFQSRYQIGAAILKLNGKTIRQALLNDGAMFTKLPDPILPYDTLTTSIDNNTQEPSAIIKDGKIELYYVGLSLSKPNSAIGVSGQDIKSVGIAKAVFDFDLNLISKSGIYLINQVNITEMKYINGIYHLFYTTQGNGDFHKGENIGYYRSSDGFSWEGPETLIEHGSGSDFNNWGVMAPTVVVDNDSLVMFFSSWQIQDRICFPDPLTPDTRFGMPFSNENQCIYGSFGRAVAPIPEDF